MSTYDVRVWAIKEHKGKDRKTGKARTTYRVRWVVAGKEFGEGFQTRALAESFRSRLIVAQREGVAFDEPSGLPEPMVRERNTRSWYQHAIAYVDMKWPRASAGHRKGIAESLATVTPSLLSTNRGVPSNEEMRAALYRWVFNRSARQSGPPPDDLAPVVTWLEANTVDLGALKDAALTRKVLDSLALRIDGTPASPATVARKRAILSGALKYAVELGLLESHPLTLISWEAPRLDDAVDRRVVVNPTQAAALLRAVQKDSPELEAFFGCMYYAGLRPEEVRHLANDEYERPTKKGGWGWFHLTGGTVSPGEDWTDDNETVEDRGLKHRAASATRDVPVAPDLVALLDHHIKEYPPASNGRLFVTRRGPGGRYVPTAGQPIPNNAHTTAWRKARAKALTPAQQRTPMAKRPYDLRHACLSTWLNSGVPATQVAEWAGNSVKVLLDVYAKCIDGDSHSALKRVEDALRQAPGTPSVRRRKK